MNEERLGQILQESAEQGIPADLDLWNSVRARVQARRRSATLLPRIPVARLGWVFLTLIVLLALGAVAYAIDPAVSRMFHEITGLGQNEQSKLVQKLNLSRTVSGVTVNLQRAYADANQIVVGYTIKSSDGQRYEPYVEALTDTSGRTFYAQGGMGVTGQSEVLNVSLPPGEGAYVFSFDASPITNAPSVLHLRLGFQAERFTLPTSIPEPTVPRPTQVVDSSAAEAKYAVREKRQLVGPFVFEFTVPFIPGQRVQVNQSVEHAGIKARLESVIITPSATSATMCFESLPQDFQDWSPIVELNPGRGASLSASFESRGPKGSPTNCHRIMYLNNLAGRSGTWTMTVNEMIGFDLKQPGGQTRVKGPWTFRFQVP